MLKLNVPNYFRMASSPALEMVSQFPHRSLIVFTEFFHCCRAFGGVSVAAAAGVGCVRMDVAVATIVVPNRKDRRVGDSACSVVIVIVIVIVIGVVGLNGAGYDNHAAVATTRENSSKILRESSSWYCLDAVVHNIHIPTYPHSFERLAQTPSPLSIVIGF